MSASYQAILWNRQKKIYDTILVSFLLLYAILFVSVNLIIHPEITFETLLIRTTATLAFLLLHIILMIGPLARLHPVFLPLLYNRRHLGVTMFCVAAIHGIFSIIQFHALGNVHPLVSLFLSNTHYGSLPYFPFQALGFLALIIFMLMAVTSHDFWLENLSPKVWKTLHMGVYLAYALVLMHVMLGVIQYETSPVLVVLLGLGLLLLLGLHVAASRKEHQKDQEGFAYNPEADGFIRVCALDEIAENRAKIVSLPEERIAIFRYANHLSAVSNVCKHQNGPLGEGRIIDGCITCPWHGYQYLPHNGSSPPPFKEKVATYDVKLVGRTVYVHPKAYPEGTERPPAVVPTNTIMI